jgi:hypothetical protein
LKSARPKSTPFSERPSALEFCGYGPLTPTNAWTLCAPIVICETVIGVLAPASVTWTSAPFWNATLPET